MFKIEDKNHRKKYFITIALASILSLLFVVFDNNAYAMGPPPSACPNLYDSVFTSIWIQSEGVTYNPVLTPGVVIPVQNSVGYKLNFTLHTSAAHAGINYWNGINNTSVYGPNTQPGSTWYQNTNYGFADDNCVYNVGPNQDVVFPTTTVNYYLPDGSVRLVSWGTSISGAPQDEQTTYFYLYQSGPVTSPPTDAPRNLSALAISSSRIDLYWNAPIINFLNQGAVVPGYKIERSIDNGTTWSTIVSNTNSTYGYYSDQGLTHSTTYFYRVSKVTMGLSGSPSNWAGATTFNVPPSQPSELTANVFNSSQIDLDWNAPSDNGGTSITGYKIERSTDSGSTWNTIIANTGSASTTYSDTGLSPSTAYTYRVSAINSVGTSSPSNTATATTPS